MPAVILPDDLRQQLNKSESGTINDTRGPGVAVYWSTDGRTRADIYIGLELDGVIRYQNLSAVDPGIKLQFALTSVVACTYDDIDFDPSKDKVITITVNRCSSNSIRSCQDKYRQNSDTVVNKYRKQRTLKFHWDQFPCNFLADFLATSSTSP